MDNRTLREKNSYNKKKLKTEKYSSVMNHTAAYYFDYRISVISDIFKDIGNKNVLELGSQSWRGLLWKNNLKPKKITCINISESELDNGIRLAKGTDFDIDFKIMDANSLEFEDNSFDIVFGGAILHHLNFSKAVKEVHRVLSPGGEIFFIEPLGINPIAKTVRLLTPFARTKDEKPLGLKELKELGLLFNTQCYYEQLFSVPLGIISKFVFKNQKNILTLMAFHCDRFIDRTIPLLRPLFRNIIIHGRKI